MSSTYQKPDLYPQVDPEKGQRQPQTVNATPVYGTAQASSGAQVVATPVNTNNNNTMKTPLVGDQPQPLYTIQGATVFVQENKSNKCCWCFCGCCIVIIILGIIAGIIAGVVASQCLNPAFNQTNDFPFSANMTALEINSKAGATVYLNAVDSKNGTVSLHRYSNKQETLNNYKFSGKTEGNKFIFTVTYEGEFDIMACPHAMINISVPQSMMDTLDVTVTTVNGFVKADNLDSISPSLGSVSLKTTNGAVEITNGMSATSLTVSSVDGALRADNLNVNGSASLSTTNGGVKITTATITGKMTLSSSNGKIETKNANVGDLSVKTTNGGIELDGLGVAGSQWSQEGTVSTTNGKVEVEFASSFKGTYSLSTTNGNVEVDGKNIDGKSAKGKVNGGGSSSIKITTTNGGVEIETK